MQHELDSFPLGHTFLKEFFRKLDRKLGDFVSQSLIHAPDGIIEETKPNLDEIQERSEEEISNLWTIKEQLLFDQGLKLYPGTMPPNERWKEISNLTSRSMEECVDHYISIRKKIIELLEQQKSENQNQSSSFSFSFPSAPSNNNTNTNTNNTSVLPSIEETGKINALNRESLLPSLNINPKPNGTCIEISNLHTIGIGLLYCYNINISVYCNRCNNPNKVILISGKSMKLLCTKCKLNLNVSYTGAIMMKLSNNKYCVGYVVMDNTKGNVDLLSSSEFIATCFDCGTENHILSKSNGLYGEEKCRSCHKDLMFEFTESSFTIINQPHNSERVKQDIKKAEGIRTGQPLKDEGCCSHYRKSHRWLRFPCCGLAYPCDKCHDAVQDHKSEWAKSMICGYCSSEQSVEQKCKSCNKFVVDPNQFHAHWEGGKGCRDKTRMSRDDSKKYANLSKTVSRKQAEKKTQK